MPTTARQERWKRDNTLTPEKITLARLVLDDVRAGKPVLDTILAGVKGPLKDLVRVLVDVGLPPAVTTVLNSIVGG